MKKNLKIGLLAMLLCISATFTTRSQVTIGVLEPPLKGALLDLKERDVLSGANSERGLMLPRVELSDKNELYPMYSNDLANYNANKADLKKSHTGLIVYNTKEDETNDLCLGLNQWDGEAWHCFSAKMGSAQFDPVLCENIVVNGAYVEGVSTDASNFLTIKILNVTKPGSYSIKVTTENGYNFYTSGVALSVGEMVLNIPCQGMPIKEHVDNLTFEGLTLATGCVPTVKVATSIATYSIDCASITVNGMYVKGDALLTSDASTGNYISVTLRTSKAGSCYISTPTVNGISFVYDKDLTEGTQTVKLLGRGTPTVHIDFPITLTANTPSGNSTCSTTIPMTLPAMTIAVIGEYESTYSWTSRSRVNALSASSGSFGTGADAKVRTKSITRIWETRVANDAAKYLNDGYLVNNKYVKPDVVLYFAYGCEANADLVSALSKYINNGGVLIYGAVSDNSAQVTACNKILTDIFPGFNWGTYDASPAAYQGDVNTGSNNSGWEDCCYLIKNLPNSQIVNGPFGNLAESYWAEDNGQNGTLVVRALPPNSVNVCSATPVGGNQGMNPNFSVVWYNESKNFVYFGDSTGSRMPSVNLGDFNASNMYPSIYTDSGLPASKLYGPGNDNNAHRRFINNSALELNAVAWALRKAAVSGINPH